jgi:hypothetical protein
MSAASTYLEAKVLNHVLTATAYTQPSTRYVALFNNTSGNALANLQNGTLTDEVSTANSSSYARQAVTFAAAATTGSGLTAVTTSATNATVTFPTAGYTWGSITHVAVMDGATAGAGNVLFFGAVTTAKQIDVGDTFQITSGNLTVALA